MGGSAGASSAAVNVATDKSGAIADGTAVPQANKVTFAAAAANSFVDGDSFTVNVELSDGSSYSETYTSSKKNAAGVLQRSDGTSYGTDLTAFSTITAAEIGGLVNDIYTRSPGLQELYASPAAGANMTFTANVASFNTPTVSNVTLVGGNAKLSAQSEITTVGKGAFKTLDVSQLSTYKGDGSVRAEDAIFTVNGVQFAFVDSAAAANALGGNVNTVQVTGANPAAGDVSGMVDLINHMAGLSIQTPTTGTTIEMFTRGSAGSSGGLTLQIGDTADKWNKLSVNINDMHASAMGISGIDISGQSGAQSAMNAIKSAIN
jgi:flagellin